MSRVLLVEDDRSLGSTLTERLRKEGFETEWNSTLADARRAFEQGGWDVVILDVGLPDGSGLDEFIPKPFHLKELFIRIRRVLETRATRHVVSLGRETIDLQAMAIVHEDGSREYPQSRDFQVLRLLIESAPRVVSRDEILDRVWGEDRFPTPRAVDNAIVRLRQLLGHAGAGAIRSVRGIGYQWSEIEGEDNGV